VESDEGKMDRRALLKEKRRAHSPPLKSRKPQQNSNKKGSSKTPSGSNRRVGSIYQSSTTQQNAQQHPSTYHYGNENVEEKREGHFRRQRRVRKSPIDQSITREQRNSKNSDNNVNIPPPHLSQSHLQASHAIAEQIGAAVMSELTRVVDTVTADIRLVSQQLRDISISVNESFNGGTTIPSASNGKGRDVSQPHRSKTPSDNIKSTTISSNRRDTHRYDDMEVSRSDVSDVVVMVKDEASPSISMTAEDGERVLSDLISNGIRRKLLKILQSQGDDDI
jgi:hypothetical protein